MGIEPTTCSLRITADDSKILINRDFEHFYPVAMMPTVAQFFATFLIIMIINQVYTFERSSD